MHRIQIHLEMGVVATQRHNYPSMNKGLTANLSSVKQLLRFALRCLQGNSMVEQTG